MIIKLSPSQMDTELTASVSGDTITLNGDVIDFSQLKDDEILPSTAIASEWVAGDVRRMNGDIHLTLVLPHGSSAPYATRYPVAFTEPMEIKSGIIPLPIYDEAKND